MTGNLLLHVDRVTHRYDNLVTVDNLSLPLEYGQRLALRGANGSGKTTLLSLIDGTLTPASGRIMFAGNDITTWPPHRRAAFGIARVFQTPQAAARLSVRANILLGVRQHRHQGLKALPMTAAMARELDANAYEIAAWVGLTGLADVPAGLLSYGHRRQLDLAMALAIEPVLLLLDEPTAGLSPDETVIITGLLRDLPPRIAYVLVEHDTVVADRTTTAAVRLGPTADNTQVLR
ncbi:ATP-binding cassette domain-containing protein [Hamadaea tsunoensis]|uniref:ATP-binding cassette domain-containing protein n=1 Tax=Hamadaea tsunoensis TaxID=53368 RepID=UPI0004063B5C|nr:ATP-binding cassette domain-containing protein [Hamadaea tsunoensis]